MKNSGKFKTVWWGILGFVIGSYLLRRYPMLIEGNPSYFDVVVFIIWIGVCLAPIFQEMDLFGVKLKQQIDDLKKDISHQLSILKTEIKSSIEVSNANFNYVNFRHGAVPPKDSEIPDLSKQIQRTLNKKGITAAQDDVFDYGVDPIPIEMFKVRLSFEKLLHKYLDIYEISPPAYSVGKLLCGLRNHMGISSNVIHGVMEVVSVCNYAIHGGHLSKAQIAFVRESAPGLLKAPKN